MASVLTRPRTKQNAGLAINNKQGAIFLQKGGPNTPLEYLGCHGMSGYSSNDSEPEYGYCLYDGEYITKSVTKAPPEGTSFDISSDFEAIASALDLVEPGCLVTIHVKHSNCGKPSNMCEFDVVRTTPRLSINTDEPGDLVGMMEEARIERSFSLTSPDLTKPLYKPYPQRFSVVVEEAGFQAGADLVNLHIPAGRGSCGGLCGRAYDPCDIMIAGTNSGTGVLDEGTNEPGIVYSLDGGETWTFIPFGETITAIFTHAVLLDNDGFVALGTDSTGGDVFAVYGVIGENSSTIVGNTEIATGLTTPAIGGVYTDGVNVWFTVLNRIYSSEDGGVTWTLRNTPVVGDVLTSIQLNGDVGYAVGNDAGGTLVYRSGNAGVTWTDISPTPSLGNANQVFITGYDVWLATANGLYYSRNDGTTWLARQIAGATAVSAIEFYDDYRGVLIAGARVFYTYSGGYSWCELALPGITPTGIEMCKAGSFWAHDAAGGLVKYGAKRA